MTREVLSLNRISRRGLAAIAVIACAVVLTSAQGVFAAASSTPSHANEASPQPVVKTANGWVRGAAKTNYDEFLGIPYAVPPIGSLRWKPPQPAANWSGVRDATRFGNSCVQGTSWDPGYETPKLTEDCLYLNVYTPHDRTGSLSVLVWIHGGASSAVPDATLTQGSSSSRAT